MLPVEERIRAHLGRGDPVWLFLDYDGTLASFAPTPDTIVPNQQIIKLLTRLKEQPQLRVTVVSGRSLPHIEKLLPIPGILLAGTYGIEMYLPGGEREQRIELETIRPVLELIKPVWEELIEGREGFYLEDKGWAIALHARFAKDDEARMAINAAREAAIAEILPDRFRILGGNRFLEVGSNLANKGNTVRYLMERFPLADALPIFMGDDDKDEEAFKVIKEMGGVAVVVAESPRKTAADMRLETPRHALEWLERQFA